MWSQKHHLCSPQVVNVNFVSPILVIIFCPSILCPSILYAATSASSTPPKLKGPSTPKMDWSSGVEIRIVYKQPVDEFHPTVQQLIELGYDVQQSFEAVEHHESLEGAMDYLLSLEEEGEIFHRSTLDEGHRYPEEREMEFVEESQEERAM